jgi:hypothetical protein
MVPRSLSSIAALALIGLAHVTGPVQARLKVLVTMKLIHHWSRIRLV